MDKYIEKQAAVDELWKALWKYEDESEQAFQTHEELDIGDWFQHRIFVQKMSDIDRQTIIDMPAADVEPVRHGRWVGYPECLKYTNAYSDDHIVCSVCEECYSILDNDCGRFNYCPNCGARMDGK